MFESTYSKNHSYYMNEFKKQRPAENVAAPVLETLLDLTFNDIDMCIEPISVELLQ